MGWMGVDGLQMVVGGFAGCRGRFLECSCAVRGRFVGGLWSFVFSRESARAVGQFRAPCVGRRLLDSSKCVAALQAVCS
eukprot:12286918-Alexandrium_andersonii.AAC.1